MLPYVVAYMCIHMLIDVVFITIVVIRVIWRFSHFIIPLLSMSANGRVSSRSSFVYLLLFLYVKKTHELSAWEKELNPLNVIIWTLWTLEIGLKLVFWPTPRSQMCDSLELLTYIRSDPVSPLQILLLIFNNAKVFLNISFSSCAANILL